MSPTTAANTCVGLGKENDNAISIPRKTLPMETLSLLSNTTIDRCGLRDPTSRRSLPRCIHREYSYCVRGPSCKYCYEAKIYLFYANHATNTQYRVQVSNTMTNTCF